MKTQRLFSILLFLLFISVHTYAQPQLTEPIPSQKPDKYQKDQIKRKYGMFIHFGINTFHNEEWTDGSKPAASYKPSGIDAHIKQLHKQFSHPDAPSESGQSSAASPEFHLP